MDDLRKQADVSKRTCSEPECSNPHRARGLCSTHYNQQAGRSFATEQVACAHPGCGLTTAKRVDPRRPKRYCSDLCRDLTVTPSWSCPVPDAHPSRSTRVPPTHPCRVTWPEVGATWKVFYRDCVTCDRLFVTPYTISTCSDLCAEAKKRDDKKRERDKRRASKRAAFVAPVYRARIYERDNWTCHLCGKKMHRTAVVPHPRAATLDHIVPLASGGTHEPANVAAAHYLCNVRKGARGGGEQLALL